MAQTAAPRTPHRPPPGGMAGGLARGGTIFAGILLLVDGLLSILKGIAGIISNNAFAGVGNYVYAFSVNSWGWLHLGVGIVVVLAGLGILARAPLARAFGVAMASLSIIANFIWLPYQPVWALISIAIDIFVVWALCTDRRRVQMD
ncbi:hypothetical protein GCM10018793_05370 [Streptomyces sulfonofaciens]|uniref:DUF7144 domain-containing protein n=1 Tax=Streptomyces sulfonofaciens TaxID=68272 RepID=A0A919FR91_9ACTN|nr:hypothetical protein [Streptomyces sulfonofaciens]GHH70793.1 hypothetical protein GCM10018793_05370 [Streptomyces sulfonofaciens]